MKRILVVDDSETVLSILKKEIDQHDDIEAIYAKNYKDAARIINDYKNNIHAALLDINLPDAPNGEVISLANSYNIPVIVLTASMTKEVRNTIHKKDIVTYILKNNKLSIKHAINAIERVLKNYDTTVLVVDDSKTYRTTLSLFLRQNHLNVVEAENGQIALDILQKNTQNISIVITDYIMPVMDGLELTINIREKYSKYQLGIIVISTIGDKDTIADFLKFGANDFIIKPFTKNEVVTRINSNLELLELFEKITNMANRDFLTGAYNRRYFFDIGNSIFLNAKRNRSSIAVASLDIDNFKKINDVYGHHVGDIAIKEIKRILDKNLTRPSIFARFGGEEFCILIQDAKVEDIKNLFEKIRQDCESNKIIINECAISYTVSFGIAYGMLQSLEHMIKLSDKALYDAKENGKNQVVIRNT
jgi:diguanylate cyclase (GGDEF)-like protein